MGSSWLAVTQSCLKHDHWSSEAKCAWVCAHSDAFTQIYKRVSFVLLDRLPKVALHPLAPRVSSMFIAISLGEKRELASRRSVHHNCGVQVVWTS